MHGVGPYGIIGLSCESFPVFYQVFCSITTGMNKVLNDILLSVHKGLVPFLLSLTV